MVAILLTAIFTATAVIAVSAIWGTVQRYGGSALKLHREVRSLGGTRDVRVSIAEVKVRSSGIILRPRFTRPETAQPDHGWRAAA